MGLTIVTSTRFADHVTPPGHPERPERAEAMEVVAGRWRNEGVPCVEPRAASDADLLRVHDEAYVRRIAELRGRAAMLDPDTFTSPESDDVARLAAGAVLTGVDLVLEGGDGARAIALVRPPGHHAERDRAMGFCLYNSIAVGAAYARSRGVERVAIVDYDVHHGNGTQAIFDEDPSVLFVSSHQYPFYPGTGAASEVGRGAGRGRTVNLPLEVGATDADYDRLFERVVVPVLRQFAPGLILVSAGFDAHERDPLAGMRMTTEGYGRLTARILAAADEVCGGRLVIATEGGYDTRALHDCLNEVIALAAGRSTVDLASPAIGETSRGQRALAEILSVQRDHWSL